MGSNAAVRVGSRTSNRGARSYIAPAGIRR
jgi:hypothetical protein